MKWFVFLLTLVIFVACLALEFGRLTAKPFPPKSFGDPLMQFKYGSIGAEVNGYPFVIWRELPTIFPDRLPRGWRTFGFVYEDGQNLPIGVSVRRTAVRRVGFNCATCHTAKISVDGKDQLLIGAPAEQLDIQSYLLFLAQIGNDPRLTPEAVFKAAEANGRPMGPLDKAILKHLIFPRLKTVSTDLADDFSWMKVKPPHGPGRTDAGNVWRQRWGLQPGRDSRVGTVDFPSVWNQRVRQGGWFHWDGNNNSLTERNYSAALAGGATDWLLDRRGIGKVSNWLQDLPPPRFPLPTDPARAAVGLEIYRREGCGGCHDPGGAGFGQVTPLAAIGTDRQRADLFDAEMVKHFQQVGAKYSWRFTHYRVSGGYANAPLDGIWARAPYLHNGSVPTLEALLSPPSERPARFFRGCPEFDPVKVGFACAQGFSFDTALTGNGNGGHLYGTGLSTAERSDLIEYLKTL